MQCPDTAVMASEDTNDIASLEVPNPDRAIPRASHKHGERRVWQVLFHLEAGDSIRMTREDLDSAASLAPVALNDESLRVHRLPRPGAWCRPESVSLGYFEGALLRRAVRRAPAATVVALGSSSKLWRALCRQVRDFVVFRRPGDEG